MLQITYRAHKEDPALDWTKSRIQTTVSCRSPGMHVRPACPGFQSPQYSANAFERFQRRRCNAAQTRKL